MRRNADRRPVVGDVCSRQSSTTGDGFRERDRRLRSPRHDPDKYRGAVATTRAEEIRRLERGWWRRLLLVLAGPREVFAELRDASDEQAEALAEPMVAVTSSPASPMSSLRHAPGGSSTTRSRLAADRRRGVLRRRARRSPRTTGSVAQPCCWGSAACGSIGALPARRARSSAFAAAPFVLALLVLAVAARALRRRPLSLRRLGRWDDGLRAQCSDAVFVAWALLLAIVGIAPSKVELLVRPCARRPSRRRLFGLLLAAAISASREHRSRRARAPRRGSRRCARSSGKAPLRTSSAYVSSASRIVAREIGVALDEARRAPLRTGRAGRARRAPGRRRPRRRRCRSSGSCSAPVMRAATGGGTPRARARSSPPPRAPSASSSSCRACSAVRPCALKPPSIVADCGVSPMWPITGMPAPTIARARESIGPAPSSFTASAPASLTKRIAFSTAVSSETW